MCRTVYTCIICLFFFTAIAYQGYGQTPIYLHYDVGDGLPGNIVYCTAQDENGIMWFGTDKGLASFDGVRFRTYGLKDGLPDPEVLNLFLDSKGRLWISCFRKKPCYRYKGKIYTEKEDSFIEKINITTSICEYYEEKGEGVWILGHSGSIYLYADNGSFKEIKLISHGSVKKLGKIADQLIGVEQRFLVMINDQKISDSLLINNKFKQQTFQGIAFSGNNILLSSSEYSEILHYKDKKIEVVRKIQGLGGRAYVDQENSFWISSSRDGCARLDDPTNPNGACTFFLKNKKINNVFEDRDKGKWFCTSGEGIYYLPVSHAMLFDNSTEIISNNITYVTNDRDKIYFGDDEANIYTINSDGVKKIFTLSNIGLNRTRQIIAKNDSFAIALDAGLFLINRSIPFFVPESSSSKYVIKDGNDFLYGTAIRLSRYAVQNKKETPVFISRTTAIAVDNEHYIWAGGVDGLYTSSDTFSKNWGGIFPNLKSRIVALEKADTRGVWAVTPGEGLLLVTTQGGKITQVKKMNSYFDKPIDNIQALQVDGKGRLWMATNSGVYCLDKTNEIVHFDSNNGLPANDVNSIVVTDNTLWAATVAGLSKITLTDNHTNTSFSTLISSLRFKNSHKDTCIHLLDQISGDSIFMLPPNASLITLDLAGLDYSSRGNMMYSCIVSKALPPLRWLTFDNLFSFIASGFRFKNDTTNISTTSFSFGVNLHSGKYKTQVYAINPAGVKSEFPASISLIKKPYWYQTIWTYLTIWALILLLVWRFLSTILENRKLLTSVSTLRLQAIKSQINPHFIGNSINAIQQFFYPPDPLNASKYIETFTRLLRRTMYYADASFSTISAEVSYDEDYLNLIQLRFGSRFKYKINIPESLNRDLPFPTMLIQPLLENATIHGLSPSGTSILEMNIEVRSDGFIICSITDNGVGINHTKPKNKVKSDGHKSMGISLLETKIKTLNELYKVNCRLYIQDICDTDKEGNGTIATLSFNPANIKLSQIAR